MLYEVITANRLYHVPAEGGLPVPYPMPQSGAGDLSPDGRQVVYSPLFRDFRAWKRYEGGWAEDLVITSYSIHYTKLYEGLFLPADWQR